MIYPNTLKPDDVYNKSNGWVKNVYDTFHEVYTTRPTAKTQDAVNKGDLYILLMVLC